MNESEFNEYDINGFRGELEALLTGEINLKSFHKISYALPELKIGELVKIRNGSARVEYNKHVRAIKISYDTRGEDSAESGVYRVIYLQEAFL
tara:strand:- start:2873 stop:3151 length:279 start_codon:yes stop_codon:yes gene_type:complete